MPSMGWADGMGVVPCWGSSPVVDLADRLDRPAGTMLLVAAGEFGLCLKSFAAHRLAGHPEPQTAYVIERRPETLVRQALLMAISLDDQISLRERTEVFLECYGNTLLSERAAKYVRRRAAALVAVLLGDDSQSALARAIDVSLLKHKDLDRLLQVAKLWADGLQFETEHFWEERLRQYYKARYDSRKNAADWDYHMKLKELGAALVNPREFTRWRLTGMAYEFGDKAYTKPNFTLGCYAQGREGGRSVERHGYWGDVVNSPYLAHGIKANREGLFRKRNNEYVHSSTDIAKYNVTKLLHAFMTATEIEPPVSQSGIGGDRAETTDEEEPKPSSDQSAGPPSARLVLVLGEPQQLLRRQRYQGLFDSAYVASSSAGEDLTPLVATLAPGAVLVIETAKFVLDLRREQKTEFLRRLYAAAEQAGTLGLLPMADKAHQGRGAAATGEAASHIVLRCSGQPDGTVSFPEIEPLKPASTKPETEPAAAEAEPPTEELATVSAVSQAPADEIGRATDVEWQLVHRHVSRASNRPRELLLRVRIPGLLGIGALELDVKPEQVWLKHPETPEMELQVPLPFPVLADEGTAKFDAATQMLSVMMPVCPAEEKPEEALLGLEGKQEEQQGETNVMARDQTTMGGLGMAIPKKLGQNIMF